MLLEFERLEERDPRDLQRVTQLISYLVRHQFVHAEDRGGASMLETLHRSHLATLVADYVDVAGYRLVVRETEGWAGILPDVERIGFQRLRIDETIVLLVMRRIWEEALQDGEIYAYGSAPTTLNEAYLAYQDIVAGTRRAALSVAAFREVIEVLERRSIVRLGPIDVEAQDMELTVRALITTVAGDDFVASLDQILARPVEVTEAAGDEKGEAL
ncbi:DUF4194 domain-containing protein [Sphingomonas parva]|uniref:DUF4194 domain-containing protein n=1 Tax=Sphingomonas parva TaxID=2555898 RepID=UPI00142F8442|nr:DUF4194 domain-containing protein [Sphingomonas parva]